MKKMHYGKSPQEKKFGHKGNSGAADYSPRMVQTSSKMSAKDTVVKPGCYKPTAHSGSVGISGKQTEWKMVASATPNG